MVLIIFVWWTNDFCADTDWGDHFVSRQVTLFFVFTAPKPVLVVFSSELATVVQSGATIAQVAGFGFTANSGLRTLRVGRKK